MISKEKYWMVGESNSDFTHYYGGFYKDGKPVFTMAIADALHIVSLENARQLFAVLNTILPCEIWMVDGHSVTKIQSDQ